MFFKADIQSHRVIGAVEIHVECCIVWYIKLNVVIKKQYHVDTQYLSIITFNGLRYFW